MPPPETALTHRWSLWSSNIATEENDSVFACSRLPPPRGSEGRNIHQRVPPERNHFNGWRVNYPQDEPGVRHNWMSDAGRRHVTIKCIARKMEYNHNFT